MVIELSTGPGSSGDLYVPPCVSGGGLYSDIEQITLREFGFAARNILETNGFFLVDSRKIIFDPIEDGSGRLPAIGSDPVEYGLNIRDEDNCEVGKVSAAGGPSGTITLISFSPELDILTPELREAWLAKKILKDSSDPDPKSYVLEPFCDYSDSSGPTPVRFDLVCSDLALGKVFQFNKDGHQIYVSSELRAAAETWQVSYHYQNEIQIEGCNIPLSLVREDGIVKYLLILPASNNEGLPRVDKQILISPEPLQFEHETLYYLEPSAAPWIAKLIKHQYELFGHESVFNDDYSEVRFNLSETDIDEVARAMYGLSYTMRAQILDRVDTQSNWRSCHETGITKDMLLDATRYEWYILREYGRVLGEDVKTLDDPERSHVLVSKLEGLIYRKRQPDELVQRFERVVMDAGRLFPWGEEDRVHL